MTDDHVGAPIIRQLDQRLDRAFRVVGGLEFAFDSPGIYAAGFPIWTPTPGEVIYNGWVSITTAWDWGGGGSPPTANFATSLNHFDYINAVGVPLNLRDGGGFGSETIDLLTRVNESDGFDGTSGTLDFLGAQAAFCANGSLGRYLPCEVMTDSPICVNVFKNDESGLTQGAAELYLLVATPVMT